MIDMIDYAPARERLANVPARWRTEQMGAALTDWANATMLNQRLSAVLSEVDRDLSGVLGVVPVDLDRAESLALRRLALDALVQRCPAPQADPLAGLLGEPLAAVREELLGLCRSASVSLPRYCSAVEEWRLALLRGHRSAPPLFGAETAGLCADLAGLLGVCDEWSVNAARWLAIDSATADCVALLAAGDALAGQGRELFNRAVAFETLRAQVDAGLAFGPVDPALPFAQPFQPLSMADGQVTRRQEALSVLRQLVRRERVAEVVR